MNPAEIMMDPTLAKQLQDEKTEADNMAQTAFPDEGDDF